MSKKYEQIKEIYKILCKKGFDGEFSRAKFLYNAGYRKTFTSDFARKTQEAFKEGYIQGCIDSIEETAEELLNKFRDILIRISFSYMFSTDTSMISETLDESIGELKEMAKQYDVVFEDD